MDAIAPSPRAGSSFALAFGDSHLGSGSALEMLGGADGGRRLTYLRFHLLWTIPPTILLALLYRPLFSRRDAGRTFCAS